MLTFIKFTPFDPSLKSFSFLLHPRLKHSNIIDDALLDLDFFLDDEGRVQLWGASPSLWSSRSDLGVYLNHQLLHSKPVLLRNGDIVAFPKHRHGLKTAVRFRVEVETLSLSCGVDMELDMVRMMAAEMRAEQERGCSPGTSTEVDIPDPAATHSEAPPVFSYAALISSLPASDPPHSSHKPAHLSSNSAVQASPSSVPTPPPRSAAVLPSSSPCTAVLCSPTLMPTSELQCGPTPSSPTVSPAAHDAPQPIGKNSVSSSTSAPPVSTKVGDVSFTSCSSSLDTLTIALRRFRQGWMDARRAMLVAGALPSRTDSVLPGFSCEALSPASPHYTLVPASTTAPSSLSSTAQSCVRSAHTALQRVQAALFDLRQGLTAASKMASDVAPIRAFNTCGLSQSQPPVSASPHSGAERAVPGAPDVYPGYARPFHSPPSAPLFSPSLPLSFSTAPTGSTMIAPLLHHLVAAAASYCTTLASMTFCSAPHDHLFSPHGLRPRR